MKMADWIPGKRWLFIGHRWMGIVLCLFFLLWFVSGVVMMYVGYPKLTSTERVGHLPVLRAQSIVVAPGQALATSGLEEAREVRLTVNAAGRPAYRIVPVGKSNVRPVVIAADNGASITSVDAEGAGMAVADYCSVEGIECRAEYLGSVEEDGYTHSKALDMHRPLYLFAIAGGETWLYVSSQTGAVVRDATRTERFWNWTGAWLHWLYPFRCGTLDPWWHDIMVWSSTIGTVLALTGIVIGVLRWRFRRRYASGQRTPYREGWMRWHHTTGLVFGTLAMTWVFSGLMSMNPWSIFDRSPPIPGLSAYAGGPWRASDLSLSAGLLAGGDIRELVWTGGADRHLLLAERNTPRPEARDAVTGLPVVLDGETIGRAVAALLPGMPPPRREVLERYDTYYYGRAPHTMTGHVDKPLPILRYVFDDPAATWIHVDPNTGAIVGELDRTGRVKRWFFAILHSFDWLPLLDRRPLWDVLLVAGSLGGIAVSLTGIRIGWRRLLRSSPDSGRN